MGTALREAISRVSAEVPADGLTAVGITGQWSSTVPGNAQRLLGGRVSVGGYAPRKVLPWVRITGAAPSPSGADPTGHALLPQNELSDIGARTRLLLEPVDCDPRQRRGPAVCDSPGDLHHGVVLDAGSVQAHRRPALDRNTSRPEPGDEHHR